MYYHCGVPLQAISEYTLAEQSYPAKLIIVPAPRTLTSKCWDALVARMKQGATVAITGVINDEESLPVSQTESFAVGGRDYLVRFEGEKIQRIEKGRMGDGKDDRWKTVTGVGPVVTEYGAGRLIRSAAPLELGDSMDALVAFYRYAMGQARVAPIFTATPQTAAVMILPSVFRDVVLYTFVSEANRDVRMQVTDLQTKAPEFAVDVPGGRTALAMIERRTGARIS